MQPINEARFIGLIILVFSLTYNHFYFHPDIVTTISESLATTAGYLFALSFLLTSISYFFNYLDQGLKLRKWLGVLALWLAFLYSLTLMARFPEKYAWGLPANLSQPEVLLGLGGMAILFMMRLNGAKFGIKHVPPKLWRPLFRVGYLALLMFIVRAVIIEWPIWVNFWQSQQLMPPPRLILSIFALLTILLRMLMTLHMMLAKPNTLEETTNSQLPITKQA